MALISDGFNTYTHGPDGELVPLQPEKMSLKIGENTLYDFDKATGLLKVAVPPEGLELLVGKISPEGTDVMLPAPFGEPIYLTGVKRTESIMPYLLRVSEAAPLPAAPKTILQKLVDNLF